MYSIPKWSKRDKGLALNRHRDSNDSTRQENRFQVRLRFKDIMHPWIAPDPLHASPLREPQQAQAGKQTSLMEKKNEKGEGGR